MRWAATLVLLGLAWAHAGCATSSSVDGGPAPGTYGAPCGAPGLHPCIPPFGCYTTPMLCVPAEPCPSLMDSDCPAGFICMGIPMMPNLCVKPCSTDADCPGPFYRCGYSHLNMGDRRLTCEDPASYIDPRALTGDGGR